MAGSDSLDSRRLYDADDHHPATHVDHGDGSLHDYRTTSDDIHN